MQGENRPRGANPEHKQQSRTKQPRKQQQTTNTRPKETATAQPKTKQQREGPLIASQKRTTRASRIEQAGQCRHQHNTQRNKTDKKNHKSTGPKGRKTKTVGDRQWAALLPVVDLPRWLGLFSFFDPGVWLVMRSCAATGWSEIECALFPFFIALSPLHRCACCSLVPFSLSMREVRTNCKHHETQFQGKSKAKQKQEKQRRHTNLPVRFAFRQQEKQQKNTKKGAKPQLPFPNAFC